MATVAKKTHLELLRQNIMDELIEKGVTEINGKSLDESTYSELKQKLVLTHYRLVDVDCTENKFF